MGFRFKRFDYVGNAGSWGSGSTARSRSESVLKDMADWLISSGTGWTLNTTRNATTSNFVEVPYWNQYTQVSYSSSYNAPALFFTNTISGCKLFMCVQGNLEGSGCFAPKTNYLERFNSTYTLYGETNQFGESTFGIILSIIPDGSSEDFGSVFDGTTTFLPYCATPMIGTCQGWGYANTSNPICYIYSNRSNYCYSYTLFATPYVIGINGNYSSDGNPSSTSEQRGYFIGRILSSISHDATDSDALYGLIQFGCCTSGMDTEFYQAYKKSNSLGTTSYNFAQTDFYTSALSRSRGNSAGCIFAQNGTRRMYIYDSSSVRWLPSDVSIMSGFMQSSAISDKTRWIPYTIGVCSNDLSTKGIISGDGFKGYLDSSLFRCALCTPNRLYDNGNFIGCENNLMLGWDSSNTDSL